jgi:hypothetical protein
MAINFQSGKNPDITSIPDTAAFRGVIVVKG